MKKWLWLLVSLVVIIGDQLSKHYILAHLLPYQSIAILPVMNFTLAFNTGSAFNFLAQSGVWHVWFFMGFTTIVSAILVVWLWRLPQKAYFAALALSLIVGGAVSNLIDRILLGHVIDFIDLYYKNYHWPIFNVADAAICVGAVLLAINLRSTELKA